MDYLASLKPGKRENAFYIRSRIIDKDRGGLQSSKNRKLYIYVWDPQKKKHVGKYVNRNRLDTLK